MGEQDALKWLENRTRKLCGDCPKCFDFTCSGAESDRCAAYRIAFSAIDSQIKNMKG